MCSIIPNLGISGVPHKFIDDMFGHNDPRTTSHYPDSLSNDESFDINEHLIKQKTRHVEAVIAIQLFEEESEVFTSCFSRFILFSTSGAG